MATTTDVLVTKYTLDPSGYTKGAQAVSHQTQKLNKELSGFRGVLDQLTRGGGGFGSAWRFALSELDSSTPILGEVVSVVKSLGIVLAGAIAAGTAFGVMAMRQGAEFESLRLGLSAYTKDASELENVWSRLKQVARLPGLGFEESARGSVRLQAAGFDARLAERAMLGFGNALATVGSGRVELDGVLLALTQIASKSQVSAEEINQIAERVPQIRQIMLGAFGTANTEQLAKMGVSPQQFILKVIDELEKLPRVAGGTQNAFENMGDAIKTAIADVGFALNAVLIPELEKVSSFVDYLSASGLVADMAKDFASIFSAGGAAEGAFDSMARLAGTLNSSFDSMLQWIASGEGLGDTMIRVASIFLGAFQMLPHILDLALRGVQEMAGFLKNFVNAIIEAINAVLKKLTDGIDIDFMGKRIGGIGAGGELSAIPKIGDFQFSDKLKEDAGVVGKIVGANAQDIYNAFQNFNPANDVLGDPSKGGFRNAMDDQTRILEDISQNTHEALRIDMQRHILGGGDLGRLGVTAVELGAVKGHGGSIKVEIQGAKNFESALAGMVTDTIAGLVRSGRLKVA